MEKNASETPLPLGKGQRLREGRGGRKGFYKTVTGMQRVPSRLPCSSREVALGCPTMDRTSNTSREVYSYASGSGYALQYTATEAAIRLYGHLGIEEAIDGTAEELPSTVPQRIYAAVIRDTDTRDALVILRDLHNFGIHALLESEYREEDFANGIE